MIDGTREPKAGGAASATATADAGSDGGITEQPKPLPKGFVLGPDGKPCRACNSYASFTSQTRALKPGARAISTTATAPQPPPDCPADVETLGRSTWTLLHSIAATYPETPSTTQQSDLKSFMRLFSRLYPCWSCADDFQAYMKREGEPRVASRGEFGNWLCEAHNDVNRKLGKPTFDCSKWEERWRTGWKDGRCD